MASEYLVEKKQELAAAARARRSRPWRRILSIAVMVVCGVVWVIPSLGSPRAPVVSAQRQDASARLTLFLAVQRVREYERRHGRLPVSIGQTGVANQRIAYDLTSDSTFVLTLSQDGGYWDLPSTVADTVYMRDALSRLGVVSPAR